MEEQIEKRIAELEQERDAFAAGANQRIFGYAAAIGELKRLVEQLDKPAEAVVPETKLVELPGVNGKHLN